MIVCHQVWFCYIFRFFLFYLFLERRCYGLISHMPVWVFSPIWYYACFCVSVGAILSGDICTCHQGALLRRWGFIPSVLGRCAFLCHLQSNQWKYVCKQIVYVWSVWEFCTDACIILSLIFARCYSIPQANVIPCVCNRYILVWTGGMFCVNFIFMYIFHVIFITSRSFQSYPLHSFYHFYIIFLRFCAP